ncbi:DUF4350 domain-containing protein [Streptomyces sp. BI20]|uniref:DUF4350 domain-containing protein n=1 Tax=Streptomyces sp. BI20 TaxID=3403460 RepID=UPI003C710299
MTTTTPAPDTTPTTSAAGRPTDLWHRARPFLLVTALLLVAGTVLALLGNRSVQGPLDPRSPSKAGSRAVAELLADRGTTTDLVTTTADAHRALGENTTLLVAFPRFLPADRARELRAAADRTGTRLVVIGADTRLTRALTGRTLDTEDPTEDPETEKTLAPGCTLPAARTAGRARLGTGPGYPPVTDRGATPCYRTGDTAALLALPRAGDPTATVLVDTGAFLRNDTLADDGNAALALNLLGTRPHLAWYIPSLTDAGDPATTGEQRDLVDLIPAGWGWALLQLAVAALLTALWRGRRHGRLVHEPLPVVVPAAETTEGRARLYRRTDARGHAADVLRTAARERLARLLGVPAVRAHDPAHLLPALTARTAAHAPTGPDRPDPTALLFGPAPADDAALVALADHLDTLEREVRSS